MDGILEDKDGFVENIDGFSGNMDGFIEDIGGLVENKDDDRGNRRLHSDIGGVVL